MVDFDKHIVQIDSVRPSDGRSALTEVMAAVAALNGDLSGRQTAFVTGGIPDRLKVWLDKLVDKLQDIVKELPAVASFTVSVGTPVNVSVSVTFVNASSHGAG